MKFYVGITGNMWFRFLAIRKPDEVNFWRPGGSGSFPAIPPGAPLLFKLHNPDNFISGGGFFVSHTNLPLSVAWEIFGERNGAASLEAMRAMIRKIRPNKPCEHDSIIECTILASPFFLQRLDWIPAPSDWVPSNIRGKVYDSEERIGAQLWADMQARLTRVEPAKAFLQAEESRRYGAEFLIGARLGQGAFRVLVTDAYGRRCAITGERTLPALEAAHIQPFEKSGPNITANGLLLRSDLRKLFDSGHLSVTLDHSVEVSRKLKEELENSRDYYALHGRTLAVEPAMQRDRPSSQFLEWHNNNIYLG